MEKLIRGLHQQLQGCSCAKSRCNYCDECTAVVEALSALEVVPRFREMSEEIERSFFVEEATSEV